uniref:Uncharacterized protein n=1 Tax=Magallana gigas TaxID=29159 RepID=A0A8W8MGN0_MAGGI
MGKREIAHLLVLSAFVALCAVVLFSTDAEAAEKETGNMVWEKEETEDDESLEEELGAITDSAKQRYFNDSEGKRDPGD